jgi:hypothetical protein
LGNTQTGKQANAKSKVKNENFVLALGQTSFQFVKFVASFFYTVTGKGKSPGMEAEGQDLICR